MPNFSDRALREQAQLDGQGLDRHLFKNVFGHTRHYYDLRRKEILREHFQHANGKRVLEIGSQSWFQWMEVLGIKPMALACINISSKAIQQGEQMAKMAGLKPKFLLMDAHNLEFPDNSFDVVFGNAILHHLDLVTALNEIERVLKPGGKIVFCEPLGINPVGKIVRLLTPHARTQDEHPLTLSDISDIQKRFDAMVYYEQFLSVPIGVVSRMFFQTPANKLMKFAFELDRSIDCNIPAIRNLYRKIIITGSSRKPNSAADAAA